MELQLPYKSIIIHGMKRVNKSIILGFFLFIGIFWGKNLHNIGALEIELIGGINQFAFSQKEHPFIEVEPSPFLIGNISIKNDVTGYLGYILNIERDSIFLNCIDFRLVTRADYFRLEFGPFIGINDEFDTLSTGILGSLELTLPGSFFLSFSGASTIGSGSIFSNNSFRENIGIETGFRRPFTITKLSYNSKKHTRYYKDYFDPVCDSLTRYQLSILFFNKFNPINVRFDAGFQTFSRTYLGIFGTSEEFNSYFGGFEINYNISRPFRIILGAEMPLNIPVGPSTNIPDEFWTLYKAYAGFAFRFF
jgi:hypothetical protein